MNLLNCSFPTLQVCVQREIKEEVILTNVAKLSTHSALPEYASPKSQKHINVQNMPPFAYIFDFGFPGCLNMQLEIPRHCLLRCHAARSRCHWS